MKDSSLGYGRSHPNIAVIKYWGKVDTINNTPSNSSVSFPLTNFQTETTVEYSNSDRFYLNGEMLSFGKKMSQVVEIFRTRSGDRRSICVRSFNNFPHSCGLASSASGFAALALALDDFYGLKTSEEELCRIARIGSGSAGRSISPGIHLFDGVFVEKLPSWREIKILSIVLSKDPKKIGSTEGMIRTRETSEFYQERLARMKEKVEAMAKCISQKDFDGFAYLTMRESNEFHGMLMETYPPIRYIKDDGFQVIEMCHRFNRDKVRVAYTFDAGPNPFIITLEQYLKEVKDFFRAYELVPCNY
ncbi:mevalonate pyrophosphate decarboxylase [Encephalitozoon intestinalis ATCC 50506]|uniref:Diphosphomevalonate decarboxylase n=1 Tax=Encephalitozoon intestinalis (strain ATCC 50506) TaxID=876142 RepID=E0S7H0_ENCIT|nr:mevalonate pyrophosphate decarboxylase [Encephalitozoon intestinalis ATCC 50506]ADM11649.1 mevalonate pyrophosphate decarboxylase [Encephalitozoon intestinalis ATCC 50506]UTX45383.1 mevalonate pyrophosphate decarboxylase [Encephalitozoon intestinalis]